jgi:hypothetical protein
LGVIGGAAVLMLLAPAGAGAQEVNTYGNGGKIVPDPGSGRGAASAPADPADPGDDTLPFTGGDVVGLAAIGAGAVAAGIVTSRVRRQRHAH